MTTHSFTRYAPVFLLLLLLSGQCLAQRLNNKSSESVTIPDTPAGRQFTAWLAAFNTGNRETIRRFIDEHFDKPPTGLLPADELADHDMLTFRETGGFVVRKIISSSSATITALVESRLTGYWVQIQFYIKSQPPDYNAVPPYNIVGLGFAMMESQTEMLPKRKLSEREIRLRIDDLMTKLISADRFSGTILVAKDGKVFYQRASGLASRAWLSPNRLDTKFNLASMTKMFTAVAVAQLAENGKFSLDDTVGKVLTDYPNKDVAERVTIRHLLTHTSGMASAERTADKLLATFRQGARTITDHLQAFVNEPLDFAPGSRFDYSNYGFILLGAMIEKASGEDYYSYIKNHIFKPAGMTNSDFFELDTDPPNIAIGLMDAPNDKRRSNALFIGVKGMPAGGAYSTVGDLLKFDVALRNHKLISAKMTDLLWTGSPQNSHYGSGFEIRRYNKTRIVGHGGGWFGITNRMEMYPELGYTVVILSNYDSDPAAIANKLREWLTQSPSNEIPTPPSFILAASVSPETVAPGEPVKIVVTVKNTGGEVEEKDC
jgi:CubicO group peptidase (beta-lactamase class C family)